MPPGTSQFIFFLLQESKHMNHSNSCHLCGETNTTSFFDLPPVPTMDGVMSMTREEAIQVPVGKVKLQFCPDLRVHSEQWV